MTGMTTFFAGSGTRIILTVLVVLSAAMILLLIRSLRHWHGKTDDIMDTMKTMDDRMDGIETGLDSLKISAEKINARLEEAQAEMAALEEKTRLLLDYHQQALAETPVPLLTEEEIPPETPDPVAAEAASLMKQTEELEKEVEALKREKQQLKDEINARIRD